MLFFGVFLCESACTAAKSRTNLSTNSVKATKQTAGPIGTKFGTHVQIHMGMDIHQTNCHSRHKGTWGVLGGQQFKSLRKLSDWHQLWFTSADSYGNGHRLNANSPSIPQAAFRAGGLGCPN